MPHAPLQHCFRDTISLDAIHQLEMNQLLEESGGRGSNLIAYKYMKPASLFIAASAYYPPHPRLFIP
jgi:hypothetical protein